MKRRDFLKFLGASVAGAALPAALADQAIARAPMWAKSVLRFECSPLEPGTHTFSAWVKMEGKWNLYVAGVTAKGGETAFEVPAPKQSFNGPCLVKGGIQIPQLEYGRTTEISEMTLERGRPV